MAEYVSHYKFTAKQKRYLKVKRCLDVILAIMLLIPAGIAIAITSIWIKLESKGPVIYKQRRPGYHQEIFTIYKLRSMRIETTDKNGRPLSDQERMTKSGNFARKTSIDELPQLINILKGEMTFIGPRPFLINDLGTYNEEQLIRFEVLPGMTSWTSIHGRNNQTIQEKYNHEIYYVKNISFALDLHIFLKTIGLVLSRKDVEDHVTDGRIAAEIMSDIKE
jgi:lipopolysaccharide/colanic/teichoic acid biosynthesis glycosyltransferase